MPGGTEKILTINSGSSSVKFSLYDTSLEAEVKLLSGKLERIGIDGGTFTALGPDGARICSRKVDLPGHGPALEVLFKWLAERPEGKNIGAVGHRVVHGGTKYTSPARIDPPMMAELKRLLRYATEHLPHEIKAIEAVTRAFPGLPQAACFDTSFHRTMPEAARTWAIPLELRDEGVVRYGFHGLSYEYIVSEMKKLDERAGGRMVVAHLGNGASMAAIRDGVSVDTTMGFTPTGGLVMSTRSGDLEVGS